jgi:hypothetical protein
VLNVAHGFEVTEIADFQNRQPADVAGDIAHATTTIRRWFMDSHTPDQEEPFARVEMRQRRRKR